MNKKDKNLSSIQIVELSKYTAPKITEVRNGDWVEYGEDNNYFQYLIDRYVGSTTNNTCISGIINMVYGKGLDALDSNRKPEQYAMMRGLLKAKDLRRVVADKYKLGLGAFRIEYKGGKITSVSHFPMETLRSGKADPKTGEVSEWFYHPDWNNKKPSDTPKPIKIFGSGTKNGEELYIVKSYESGHYYYPPVSYVGSLPYSVLEEEIADYLINDTINGFSGTKVINFNNGVPTEEKQREIRREVLGKVTGARGNKVIVAFNNNPEAKTTVEDIPLNDAPAHYQYLSDESRDKILLSHKVTSPLLLGIREAGGGLGSNADEIKNSSIFFDNIVIKPIQEEILEAIEEILAVNNINLQLYFKTIQPLEFIETSGMDEETKEEETGVKMKAIDGEDFNDEEVLSNLEGEVVDEDEWELVGSREVSDSNTSIEDWANSLIERTKSTLQKLAGFIKSTKDTKSFLDKDDYKVRYSYTEKYSSPNSRIFCRNMMSRTANSIVYRKEDIDMASFNGVNNEFGHKRANYSLFKFKGGVNCGHYWTELLYRAKNKTKKKFKDAKEVEDIPDSYKPSGISYEISKIAPKDMIGNGAHPSNLIKK